MPYYRRKGAGPELTSNKEVFMKRRKSFRKMKKINSYCYGRRDKYFVSNDDEVFIRWADDDDYIGELWHRFYDTTGWMKENYLGPASNFRERRIIVRD